MATVYVKKGATGSNNGSSWANAYNELNAINWSNVNNGDVVEISGGSSKLVYVTQIRVPSNKNNVTVRRSTTVGEDGYVIIWGGRINHLPHTQDQNWSQSGSGSSDFGMWIEGDNITVDGGTFCGITVHGWNNDGVRLSTGSSGTVRNVDTYSNGTFSGSNGSYRTNNHGMRVASNWTIEKCWIHICGQDGIQSHHGTNFDNVIIRQCWLSNEIDHNEDSRLCWNHLEHCDAVQSYRPSTGLIIEDCLIGPGWFQPIILGDVSANTVDSIVRRNTWFNNDTIRYSGKGQSFRGLFQFNVVRKWGALINDPRPTVSGGGFLDTRSASAPNGNELYDNLWVVRGSAYTDHGGQNTFARNYLDGNITGPGLGSDLTNVNVTFANEGDSGTSSAHSLSALWRNFDLTITGGGVPGNITGAAWGQGPHAFQKHTTGITYRSTPDSLHGSNSNYARFSEFSNKNATVGNPFSYQPTYRNPDGNGMSFSTSGLPPGLSDNSGTGLISGSPTTNGTYTVLQSVTTNGKTTTAEITINVSGSGGNNAPNITNPGSQVGVTGVSMNFSAPATDVDGDTLTYSTSGLPPGLFLDTNTGDVTGSPTSAFSGLVTITAEDPSGASDSATFNVTVTGGATGNNDPVGVNPGTQSSNIGDAINLIISGDDADDDSLFYAASGLPPGLSIGYTHPTESVSMTSGVLSNENSSGGTWTYSPLSDGIALAVTMVIAGTGSSPGAATHTNGDTQGGLLRFTAGQGPGAGGYPNYKDNLVTLTFGRPVTGTFEWGAYDVDNGLDGNGNIGEFINNISNTGAVDVEGNNITSTITWSNLVNAREVSFIWSSNADGNTAGFGPVGTSQIHPGPNDAVITGTITGSSQTYNPVITITDNVGGQDSFTFAWAVGGGNSPPTMLNPGNQTGAVGSPFSLAISASDPGDTLTYTEVGLPSGLAINPSTGVISGTPSAATVSTVTVTVTDTAAQPVSESFNITINPAGTGNSDPVVSSPGNQTTQQNTPVNLTILGDDADLDTLYYSVTGLPTGLSFMDIHTPEIVGYAAASLNSESSTSIVFALGTPTDGNPVTCTMTMSGTGASPGAPTHVIGSTNGGANLHDFEMGAGPGAGTYPAYKQALITLSFNRPITGSYRWSAYDVDNAPDGNSNISEFISDISEGGSLDTEGDNIRTTLSWSNLVNVSELSFIWNSNSDGNHASFGPATGDQMVIVPGPTDLSITGTPTVVQTTTVTVTAVDNLGGSHEITFTWEVTAGGGNLPPNVTNPGPQNGNVGVAESFTIVANDPDNNTPLVFSGSNLPDGLNINSSSGLISGTPTTGESLNSSVTVTDNLGASTTVNFTYTIVGSGNNAPNVTNPGTAAANLDAPYSLGIVANDPDGDTMTYTASNLPPGLNINNTTGVISGTPNTAGSYLVQVNVSDGTATTPITFSLSVSDLPAVEDLIIVQSVANAPAGLEPLVIVDDTGMNDATRPVRIVDIN